MQLQKTSPAGKEARQPSKAWKITKRFLLKPLAYASVLALTAIAGATMSTYLKREFHTNDYFAQGVPRPALEAGEREKLRAEISRLDLVPLTDRILGEIERPRAFFYGAAQPLEVRLELSRECKTFRITYWGLWGNSHVIKKQDWEPVTLTYSVESDSLTLDSITVRPHNALGVYSKANCARLQDERIPVVIANPAHTPLIPGCTYSIDRYGILDAFTEFAALDWAGFSAGHGFPQDMGPMAMTITSGSPPAESGAKRTPYF